VPSRALWRIGSFQSAGFATLLAASAGIAQQPRTEVFDVVLVGGSVIDGTGNPWFRADVGIRDGRIVAVGVLGDAETGRRIDVSGRFVVPGFIDIHSHADEGLDAEGADGTPGARRRAAPNLVSQGVTTVVVNQDGRSAWPIAEQRANLERLRFGPNTALMVGHNSIRAIALGDDFRRPATPAETDRMREMVRQAMVEGAYGLSAGLEYVPGRWSTTEEVLALVEETGRAGGLYIVHERSSGQDPMWYWPSRDPPGPPTMLHTILEDIEIAERTGVTTVATHIKARGANFWGSGRALIQLIERARARGVPIWADHYPYNTTGSDGSTVLIPEWFIRDASGEEQPPQTDFALALTNALTDPDLARDLRTDIAHEIQRRGGPDNLIVFEYPDSSAIGRSLADLASASGLDAVEMAIRLQLEGFADRPGGARIRGFSLSEIDVEAFAARPWIATASDAGIALPGDGPVHARYYGTFPRKISRYAVERGALRLEDAIRSATSLPAQILGIKDRGLVREGLQADLVVLELGALRDRATFFEPHQTAAGVDYVLINGELVVDRGELTYSLPGWILTPEGNARARTVEEGTRSRI
jgi:N-acyl-D-amino-acid deacylase